MSRELKFASSNEALQYLADLTSRSVKIATPADLEEILEKHKFEKIDRLADSGILTENTKYPQFDKYCKSVYHKWIDFEEIREYMLDDNNDEVDDYDDDTDIREMLKGVQKAVVAKIISLPMNSEEFVVLEKWDIDFDGEAYDKWEFLGEGAQGYKEYKFVGLFKNPSALEKAIQSFKYN